MDRMDGSKKYLLRNNPPATQPVTVTSARKHLDPCALISLMANAGLKSHSRLHVMLRASVERGSSGSEVQQQHPA